MKLITLSFRENDITSLSGYVKTYIVIYSYIILYYFYNPTAGWSAVISIYILISHMFPHVYYNYTDVAICHDRLTRSSVVLSRVYTGRNPIESVNVYTFNCFLATYFGRKRRQNVFSVKCWCFINLWSITRRVVKTKKLKNQKASSMDSTMDFRKERFRCINKSFKRDFSERSKIIL